MNPSSCLGCLRPAHPMKKGPHNWQIQDSEPFLQAATSVLQLTVIFSLIFFLERGLKNMVWIVVYVISAPFSGKPELALLQPYQQKQLVLSMGVFFGGSGLSSP